MGSNRKLLFGGLFALTGLVLWGLLSAVNRANSRATATPTPPSVAQNAPLKTSGSIAYATSDIPAGSIITKEMLQMRPATGSATGFTTNPEEQAVGYITRTRISKNTALRPDEDFVGHISEVGIAGALGVGKRAMVIPFANKPTLHDLVRIGNFVDVNAAFDGQEARTIVQNVRVLAVDVFGNDFPQVNIAARGPYRADVKGSGAVAPAAGAMTPNGAPVAPGAAPTATPAPAQAPARPDPAVTLEVTPTQANTILLAQASGAIMDFVVRPSLPGGLSPDIVLIDGTSGTPGTLAGGVGSGSQSGSGTGSELRSISVTKPQIAPYAERRKAAGNSGGTRTASASGSGSGSGRSNGGRDRQPIFDRLLPPPPLSNVGGSTGLGAGTPPSSGLAPAPVPPSPTYDIPIYADGRTVRVETVRRPQE